MLEQPSFWQAVFDLSDPHVRNTVQSALWGSGILFAVMAVALWSPIQKAIVFSTDEAQVILKKVHDGKEVSVGEGLVVCGNAVYRGLLILAVALVMGIV